MKAQMNLLRGLVVKDLAPAYFDRSSLQLTHWLDGLPLIKEQIFSAIQDEMLGDTDNCLVARHLQQLQYDCVFLLDTLHCYEVQQKEHTDGGMRTALPKSGPDSVLPLPDADGYQSLVSAATTCIADLLGHLERHYAAFFNRSAVAPRRYLRLAAAGMARQMNFLKTCFKRRMVEQKLGNLIVDCLVVFMEAARDTSTSAYCTYGDTDYTHGHGACIYHTGCTYQKMIYMKDLQLALINFCNQQRDESVSGNDFDRLLIEYLFYLNFNTAAFFDYCKARVSGEISGLYSAGEQLEVFCYYQKAWGGLLQAGPGFDPEHPPVGKLVQDYIKAELKYMRRKLALLGTGEPSFKSPEQSRLTPYRVRVSLSVDSLAYLIKLLVEEEVVIVGQQSELMNFIAAHFKTVGIGDKTLSANSLKKKYGQVVQTTAKGVKTALVRMIKRIDDEFRLG